MPQPMYTRKSIRNSLSNTEKIFVENIKNVINKREGNKIREELQKLTKNWDKLVYTLCILIIYLTYGLCTNIFAPIMVDMKYIYRTSIATINYGNTLNWAGYLVGAMTGFLYKYINRQLSFIVNVVLFGVFTAAQPIWSNLYLFYMSMFLSGLGGGVWDSGNSVWVAEMWKENSAPVLQLSQMMYGCGTIMGPLLVKPYICGDLTNKTDDLPSFCIVNTATAPTILNTNTNNMNDTIDEDINYSVDRSSELKIPLFISGAMSLAIPIVLLVMFFVKRYKPPEDRTQFEKTENNLAIEDNSVNKLLQVSPRTRKILIALVALSLNSYSGLENTYLTYSSTYYQYLPIHLTAPKAAVVLSIMTATYTAARGVSAFISTRLKAETMITYHIIIITISFAILHYGQNSEILIYIGNALIGFGFSAMWPSYFAFSEKHIQLTDKVTSIFAFTSALFALFAPFIIGPLIEEKPEVFLYLEMGMFCTVIILFIVIMVIVRRSQRYPISYNVNTISSS